MSHLRFHSCFSLLISAGISACSQPVVEDDDGGGDDDDTTADDDTADDDTADDDTPPLEFTGRAVDRVDPFIGTGGLGFGVGSAFPGPSLPFGAVQPSPDTSGEASSPGFAHCAGYWYEDEYIEGFSQWRLHGIGVADGGTVLLMPVDGMDESKVEESGYRSLFHHEDEEARPGYYAVTLADTGIGVELAADTHTAFHRYTWPEGADATVVLDVAHVIGENACLGAQVEVDEENQLIEGWMLNDGGLTGRNGPMPVYFSIQVNTPFATWGTWKDGVLSPQVAFQEGLDSLGAWMSFDLPLGGEVEMQVGLSHRSLAAARNNREAEGGGRSFDEVAAAGEEIWESLLRTVEVAGGTEAQQRIFYTSLYHAFLMPRTYTDVDGGYLGFDGLEHVADGFTYYNDFSLWDTFRTQNPLLALLLPDLHKDMLHSLVLMYQQGGAFPRWPVGNGDSGSMIGDSAVMVMAEGWLKGFRDFDIDATWEGLSLSADGLLEASYGGRSGIAGYIDRGWCATDEVNGAVSVTLEYAYNDYVLSLLAESLGYEDDAARYLARSQGWPGLWDPAWEFLNGRNSEGAFEDLGDPTWMMDWYTEANAWQTLWYVPHDVPRLMEVLGGRDVFLSRLDEFFESSMAAKDTALPDPYYWHGNEPDIHAPYLYLEAGRADQTQEMARWVMESRYRDTADGLDGNDDAGTLSAWYVFSSLGFFPLAGTDRYWVGSPLFPQAVIHLPSGDLTLTASQADAGAMYVDGLRLGGQEVEPTGFTHEELLTGGTLKFLLNTKKGTWGVEEGE